MQEKSIHKSYIFDSTTAILNKWSSLSVLINQDYPAYELFKEALPIIWRFSGVLFTLDKRNGYSIWHCGPDTTFFRSRSVPPCRYNCTYLLIVSSSSKRASAVSATVQLVPNSMTALMRSAKRLSLVPRCRDGNNPTSSTVNLKFCSNYEYRITSNKT